MNRSSYSIYNSYYGWQYIITFLYRGEKKVITCCGSWIFLDFSDRLLLFDIFSSTSSSMRSWGSEKSCFVEGSSFSLFFFFFLCLAASRRACSLAEGGGGGAIAAAEKGKDLGFQRTRRFFRDETPELPLWFFLYLLKYPSVFSFISWNATLYFPLFPEMPLWISLYLHKSSFFSENAWGTVKCYVYNLYTTRHESSLMRVCGVE